MIENFSKSDLRELHFECIPDRLVERVWNSIFLRAMKYMYQTGGYHSEVIYDADFESGVKN